MGELFEATVDEVRNWRMTLKHLSDGVKMLTKNTIMQFIIADMIASLCCLKILTHEDTKS